MWFFLALISAVIYSCRTLSEKLFIDRVNPYILALAVRLFAVPFFFIPFFFQPSLAADLRTLPPAFWLSVAYISMISTPIEMIFFYKALKQAEMSYVTPLLGLGPIITVLINTVIFQHPPTLMGIIGVGGVVQGIYLLNVEKNHEHFLDPVKHLLKHAVFPSLAIMLLFNASSIIVDKVGIVNSNPYLYGLINYLMVSVALLVIAFKKARPQLGQLKTHFQPFFLIGLIVAAYTFFRFLAIEQGNVGYVSAILATSTLISIIFGVVFLREKGGLQKIVAGVCLLAGLVVIKLFG